MILRKSMLSIISFIAVSNSLHAQSSYAKQLFQNINAAVEGLPGGTFDLHSSYKKIAVGEDSTNIDQLYHISFKKNKADSLLGYQLAVDYPAINYKIRYNGRYLYMLDGNTLKTTDKLKFSEPVKQIRGQTYNYPIPVAINETLQRYTNHDSLLSKLQIDTKNFGGKKCYQIVATDIQGVKGTKVAVEYYIEQQSKLPIGEVISLVRQIGQATEEQTFTYHLTDLHIAALPDSLFDKSSLTNYSREMTVDSQQPIAVSTLLPAGSQAPDWELPKIGGGQLKLSSLKGKVIVLDFWYKACAPCQQQMLALQQLHKKYSNQNVVFIGVNTIDNVVKDKLQLFLNKRNITMTNVYQGKSIEGDYWVRASPALFIINKAGSIEFSLDGYSDDLLSQITTVVDKIL